MELDRKAVAIADFKADDAGAFRATFATLNVIDRDGDVTVPGAFKDGQAVRIAQWGHNWAVPVIGKGVIHADDRKAWVEGQFFLETIAGKETYLTVKALGGLQEWSYGFYVEKYSFGKFQNEQVRFLEGLDTVEVSPVMIGAGVDTRTDSIKGHGPRGGKHYADPVLVGWQLTEARLNGVYVPTARVSKALSPAMQVATEVVLLEARQLGVRV